MITSDYKINQDVRNIAVLEADGQTACRKVIYPVQSLHPVLAPVAGDSTMEKAIIIESGKNAVSQVRPWVRYLARMVDLCLFAILVGVAIGLYAPSMLDIPSVILNVGILFVWVFQESILLTNCGTTPGKWLFKIKVRNSTGRNLSFSDALNRSFSVLFKGMGAGIPIISLISLFSSKSKLKKDGITVWDEDGGHVVTHERIGIGRSLVIAVIIVAFFALTASV